MLYPTIGWLIAAVITWAIGLYLYSEYFDDE